MSRTIVTSGGSAVTSAGAAALRFSEAALLACYFSEQGPGHLVVDVGAHTGGFSLPLVRRGWRAVCFEPEPENRAELERRLGGMAGVVIVDKAVCEETGSSVPLYVSAEHWGIHSLRPFHHTHRPGLEVTTTRLDDALRDLGVTEVTLLKVDVEGADLPVLRSFDWQAWRPRVVMAEFMDERSSTHFGYTHHDMARFLAQRGYAVFVSEWDHIREYGRRGQASAGHRFLGCARHPLDHEPAWGNLIAVLEPEADAFAAHLKRSLEALGQRGAAAGPALRQALASLPGAGWMRRMVRRMVRWS
jgi:FkbM family methyltransferase